MPPRPPHRALPSRRRRLTGHGTRDCCSARPTRTIILRHNAADDRHAFGRRETKRSGTGALTSGRHLRQINIRHARPCYFSYCSEAHYERYGEVKIWPRTLAGLARTGCRVCRRIYNGYCPDAPTLDALLEEQSRSRSASRMTRRRS